MLHIPEGAAPDEGHLLAGIRQRQAAAFEQLMRRYNKLLFRAARGIVHDDAEAQDAVQEAWLRAFTAIDTFRGEAALGTWLVRIVINQALGQQRRLGRIVPWDEDAQESDMPASEYPTPDEAAQRTQLKRALEEALDQLPPMYRAVFLLRAVQELSVQETADALLVSTDVVKTRYVRARAMLREQLDFEPHPQGLGVHGFDGERCDAMVARVLGRLREAGVLRDH